MTWTRIAVIALSLLSGSGWVLTQLYPSQVPSPLAASIHFLLVALSGVAIWSLTGRASIPWRVAGMIAAFGVALFALPGIVLHLAAGAIPELAGVVVFCSIPLSTVLILAAMSDVAGVADGRLIASVMGLGGAVLLLSFDYPRSPRAWGYLSLVAVCSVVVAGAGVKMHRKLKGVPVDAAVAVVGLGCAVVASGVALSSGWPIMSSHGLIFEVFRCAGFDLPLVWIVVWLSRRVEPDRLATRFLFAPLFTAIEGFVGMGGGVELRSLVAMGMMAAGAVWLLFRQDEEDVTSMHLE